MKKTEYNTHKKALVERCMLMSTEGLQTAILEQISAANSPQEVVEGDTDPATSTTTGESMPYILFEAMLIALERRMGKRAFAEWLARV